jgi:hypothetical protein
MRSPIRSDCDGAGQGDLAQRSVEQADDPIAFGADHRGDDAKRHEHGRNEDERADDGNHVILRSQKRPTRV